jgi:hypothetical protein
VMPLQWFLFAGSWPCPWSGCVEALPCCVTPAVASTVVAVAEVDVVALGLPQSDWAAAETISPCWGPGGVFWATLAT